MTIKNYISDLINKCNIYSSSTNITADAPQWEHINTKFITDYTDSKKSETASILAIEVREHLNKNKIK